MVDKAAQKLRAAGINSALINAGGDIYCLGDNLGKPWRVGVQDPGLSGVIEAQDLVNETIATSGNYQQYFDYQGKRYSHIIDPISGYPLSSDVLSISVISNNGTTSDALATAFCVLGLEKTKAFFYNQPSTLRIFIVTKEGEGKKVHVLK